jgi:hypothetical protein
MKLTDFGYDSIRKLTWPMVCVERCARALLPELQKEVKTS